MSDVPAAVELLARVRPSTIQGVKSLAAQLRKKHGIKHSDALEMVSKAAGFQNYRHALAASGPSGHFSVSPKKDTSHV